MAAGVLASRVAWRWREAADLGSEQPGEFDRRRVLALRPDDLQAHRQPLCGQANWRCGCRQIGQTGEPRKEQLLGVWHGLTVDLDGAFVAIRVAVVRESG